jgi:hypothetical protein
MPPPKPKKKDRIKVGSRVQLKKDSVSDGNVVAKNPGKGQWRVTWVEGSLKGTTTDQSSKSLRPWQLDLSAMPDGDSSDEGDDDDDDDDVVADGPALEVDHVERKRKFDAHAKSLVGKKVVVSLINPSQLKRSPRLPL